MRMIRLSCWLSLVVVLAACSPVKTADNNQFRLIAYSDRQVSKFQSQLTLQVTSPEAVAGYQTSQMLYTKKPFQVEAFAKNSWTNAPADMLYPLIVESLQKTHYFHAVKSSAFAGDADYRLDTLVLYLHQNFLKKPSVIELSAKVTLTNIRTNTPVASKIISLSIPCPSDSPYGGVIAANRASYQFTSEVTDFVLGRSQQKQ